MKTMRRFALAIGALLIALAAPAGAGATPILNLDLHHNPTNFHAPNVPVSSSTLTEGAAPSTDEVQKIVVGNASSGNFRLAFGASTTPNLPAGADAAQVERALRALPSIGSPNVTVTQQSVGLNRIYTVAFTGALAATDVAQIAVSQGSPRLGIEPEYWVDIANVGPDPTSGPVTLTVTLPPGITRHEVAPDQTVGANVFGPWSCPGSPGQTVITCTSNGPIPRYQVARGIVIRVAVGPSVPVGSLVTATAEVSGGAAAPAPAGAGCAPGASACTSEPTPIEIDPAPFGILAPSFVPDFFNANGLTLERQAGAHPDLLTVPFDLTSIDYPLNAGGGVNRKLASGSARNIFVDAPRGFLGDPTAVGECTPGALAFNACPPSSQVGVSEVATATFGIDSDHFVWVKPVYNMAPPPGVVSDLAFNIQGNPVHIFASLDPANDYAISTHVPNVNETLPPFDSLLTLWGTPADPSHDPQRCRPSGFDNITTNDECPAGIPPKAFLTVPFDCDAEHAWRLHDYDSWQNPDIAVPDIDYTMPGNFGGCDQIPFDPTISLAPTTDAADSPSGLDVQIDLPQSDDPDEIATSPLKDATVTLPEGLTVNPASANGLGACSPAQISLGTDDPIRCPDSARVADVKVETVLPDPVEGTVYLATPYDNPFNSLLAGYIVLSDPVRGLLVKIPGRIDVDPDTGQLTGTFEDNPQLPFSRFELHFKGGAHSSLITPSTCGDYTSNAEFAPWSGNAAVQPTDSFTIAQGAGGAPCANSESELPNSPSFDAGVVSPVSANYSPFVVHLRRSDGTQRFSAFNVTLPQGLTGKLAGTALCPDAALAAAESKSGKDEQAAPSCPLGSRVGEVVAAAGAGPSPYYARGDAYLAGPYKGAPVSLAVITPAVAGPFDLGTIVIRTPLRVDPKTAQITAVSDPIPQMLQGIPTAVRFVDVIMDRPEFTLTGTSCDPASIDGLLTSTLGQAAALSVRYQLSDCGRLGFKPRMTLNLRGGTARGRYPQLTATIMPRPGDANIRSASVAFPRSEFLANEHIRTICTRPDFAAGNCPAGAAYGTSTVFTSLLDYPLTGNVYLRSSDNLLPDLVPDLRGPAHQPIRVEAAGRTDSIKGGIRNTFDFLPDAPFTKAVLSMQGGNRGLLVNSRDICARTYRAKVIYTAHNGDRYVDHPRLRAKCGGKAKRDQRRGHGAR